MQGCFLAEYLSYRERLREMGSFSLRKAMGKPQCDLPVLKRSS